MDDAGTVKFTRVGTLYSQINGFPVTDLRFTLSHPAVGGGPSSFARFDELLVTLP